MKLNIKEVFPPPQGDRWFYTYEKSLYGGYVLYIELESNLKRSGTLDNQDTAAHWIPLPSPHYNPDQLELKFED
jgi:hypothetical protein